MPKCLVVMGSSFLVLSACGPVPWDAVDRNDQPPDHFAGAEPTHVTDTSKADQESVSIRILSKDVLKLLLDETQQHRIEKELPYG